MYLAIKAGPVAINDETDISVNYNEKPFGENWPGSWDNQKTRKNLGNWLLTGRWDSTESLPEKEIEYEGYDGWYNNIAQPELGAIGIFKIFVNFSLHDI